MLSNFFKMKHKAYDISIICSDGGNLIKKNIQIQLQYLSGIMPC